MTIAGLSWSLEEGPEVLITPESVLPTHELVM